MKKPKINFMDLVKKNKEELLNDRKELAKIEERIENKHSKLAMEQLWKLTSN
ncbi:FbpB family small basic protein [Mesobacillus maritimus]|uniref:FbpB family small basic protein n=1 Tax=Mesobacillus maritimus TaxID=1643336 RepID=UPI0020401F0C|nr:FbpB family small basic protein [Mesobacillus maritimus]MCM3587406.1 FbpB family small basic protein [Mesobacillus maritimus]MCM3667966.1 FbpB family small basic protein [Mesobacillus maritimus]